MEELARKVPGVISLSQGIPSSQSDKVIRSRVVAAINSGKVDRYSASAGLPELRELISEKLRAEGMRYHPGDEIIITAGAIEGLSSTIFALTNPGDEIIILTPTYSYYRRLAELDSKN
jgi:aminotransferase